MAGPQSQSDEDERAKGRGATVGAKRRLPKAVALAIALATMAMGGHWLGLAQRLVAGLTTSSAVAAGPTEAVAALRKIGDYETARWHPLHFRPAIETATNAQCLACHQEILTRKVNPQAAAGNKASDAIAWYQTLDTYEGKQETFHARHLTTPFAKATMNLSCNFCHKGHDPREEAPGSSASAAPHGVAASFTLRKVVDPSSTCLMCHGQFPAENMGLSGTWHENRESLETAEAPNGCLSCHAEQFRTVRHQVSFLKASAIEAKAKESSDTCFGCHGGRAWYRISYPYPRHPWPGMDASEIPEWAKDRPAQSRPEHRLDGK